MFFPWVDNTDKLMEPLLRLRPDSKPAWGRMDAQQMIEHLIFVFEISNGSKKVEVLTPEKHIKKSQIFLMSDKPMPKNFISKFIPVEPAAHQFSNLQTAISELISSIKTYHSCWVEKKETTLNHPVFGALNKKMWNQVHNKHITHHFLQFRLTE